MSALLAGMLLFFGAHSIRIVAGDWRERMVATHGENAWKGLYALVALAGFALMAWGYAETRAAPELWIPRDWRGPFAGVLTLPAFVLLVAAYVPRNRIKATVGHPMLAGTALWALAHLAGNGRANDMLLFGTFFIWATVAFFAARARDRKAARTYPAGSWATDAAVVTAGVVAWALFAVYGHLPAFGLSPFA